MKNNIFVISACQNIVFNFFIGRKENCLKNIIFFFLILIVFDSQYGNKMQF